MGVILLNELLATQFNRVYRCVNPDSVRMLSSGCYSCDTVSKLAGLPAAQCSEQSQSTNVLADDRCMSQARPEVTPGPGE